jgi:hypothetical protein
LQDRIRPANDLLWEIKEGNQDGAGKVIDANTGLTSIKGEEEGRRIE